MVVVDVGAHLVGIGGVDLSTRGEVELGIAIEGLRGPGVCQHQEIQPILSLQSPR